MPALSIIDVTHHLSKFRFSDEDHLYKLKKPIKINADG